MGERRHRVLLQLVGRGRRRRHRRRRAGRDPERPVELGRYAYPSGWNHAAFPYRSQSTGKFYLFAGDEAYPYGGLGGANDSEARRLPFRAAGWIHVIDWSDWDNPREVARYQVPEAGTHNFWVEDDILYVGFYYPGGLRVVDVSGDLMGDLYRQGREIARFVPFDPTATRRTPRSSGGRNRTRATCSSRTTTVDSGRCGSRRRPDRAGCSASRGKAAAAGPGPAGRAPGRVRDRD